MAIEQNNKCWTGKKERKKEVMVLQGRREIRRQKTRRKRRISSVEQCYIGNCLTNSSPKITKQEKK